MAAHVLYRCPPCIMCKRSDTVCLDAAQLAAYNSGTLIDAAFPGMSADRRELIKTGIHPECWNNLFPPEEEEEEEVDLTGPAFDERWSRITGI